MMAICLQHYLMKMSKVKKLFKNIRKYAYTFNHYTLRVSVLDVALFGLLTALFIVIDLLFKQYLPRRVNVQTLYVFSTIFGVLLGKWKGAMAAFIADGISILLKHQIWMYQYALIWPIVAFLTGFILEKWQKKQRIFIPIFLLSVATVVWITFLTVIYKTNPGYTTKFLFNMKLNFNLILGISSSIFSALWITMLASFFLHRREKRISARTGSRVNPIYKHLCFSISLLSFVYVTFRWVWEPYAYNIWANNSYNVTSQGYLTIASGIIFKSTFVFPISMFFFASMLEVLLIFQKKYSSRSVAR